LFKFFPSRKIYLLNFRRNITLFARDQFPPLYIYEIKIYYIRKQYRRVVTEDGQLGMYIMSEKNSGLRSADWEVGSFETLWLPVKECNIIADSVRIMCTGSRPGGKMLSFVTELPSPETSIYATFVPTPQQDSFYFGRRRKNHCGVNCVAYKHNSPDIKNVQPHNPPLLFVLVWCVISVSTCVFSRL
jgi:hypothetical protein